MAKFFLEGRAGLLRPAVLGTTPVAQILQEGPSILFRVLEKGPVAVRAAVREGIADADARRKVPFGDVKAWVRSWRTENELPIPTPPGAPRP